MGKTSSAADTRRLAVIVDSQTPLLQFVEAAAGDWSTMWVLDRDRFPTGPAARFLARLGAVADITGLDDQAAARRVAEHSPDGIMALAEEEVERVAAIGTALGLAVSSPPVARRLTNKYDQRRALADAAVPVPRFRAMPATDSRVDDAVLAGLHYPVIVKPQRGKGSRYVYRAPDAETLRAIVEANASSDAPMDLIVEDLLPDRWDRAQHPYADMVSVESIVAHGQISHLAITGRAALQEPFVETGNFIPSNLPAATADEVFDIAARALAALEVSTGAMHTEVKLTPSGPCVIEVNGRIGGSIPELMSLATDSEHVLLRTACRVALDEHVAFDAPLTCARVGYSLRVPPPVGASRLVRIDGLDTVAHIDGVSSFEMMRAAGDDVDWREGWDGCVYFALGHAHDHDAMWAAREQITKAVQLEFA